MMMGPMKKKVITSAVVTAVILIVIFVGISAIFLSQNNKKIAELTKKSEVVQRYVFAKDLTVGDVVTASDVLLVDVKGESAPNDSYEFMGDMIGRRLKVNANAKTIVTESLFYVEDKNPNMDTRLQEFNMITLPSDVDEGDYIDIRMRFPTGEDYLVLAGKKIQSFGALGTESNTVFLKLDEEEIVKMGSAIIESYIRDGIYLYANKYVDADAQLFDYDRVNYVELYEKARYEIVSGEYSGDVLVKEEEKRERTVVEIASLIGLSEDEAENIKIALKDNDEKTLDYYKNKLVTTEKSLVENYPVKIEVAKLIQSNPNILSEIKAKYNVEELEQQRIEFLDTNLIQKDPFTNEPMLDENGQIMIKDEYIQKINEKLQNEITTQKSERQEYLLGLLGGQTVTE